MSKLLIAIDMQKGFRFDGSIAVANKFNKYSSNFLIMYVLQCLKTGKNHFLKLILNRWTFKMNKVESC